MVTKHMGHMMNKLISNFDNVGQYSRKDVINLLLKLLTRDPNWSSNPSILYLLDIVCSNAFNHSTSYFLVLEFFEKIHTGLLLC